MKGKEGTKVKIDKCAGSSVQRHIREDREKQEGVRGPEDKSPMLDHPTPPPGLTLGDPYCGHRRRGVQTPELLASLPPCDTWARLSSQNLGRPNWIPASEEGLLAPTPHPALDCSPQVRKRGTGYSQESRQPTSSRVVETCS